MKNILLVHGWSYKFYNSSGIQNPWQDRPEFLGCLEELGTVHLVRLPGFCGTPEPDAESWSTADFADWLHQYIEKTGESFDYLVGYSFGCPVIVHMATRYTVTTPCILISPALRRGDSTKSKIAHMFAWLPMSIRDPLRDLYLEYMSPYFKYGTMFLRNSYKKIVRDDSVGIAVQLAERVPVYCIYGTSDTATPLQIVREELAHSKIILHTIVNGGHNIAKTHTKEIFHILKPVLS